MFAATKLIFTLLVTAVAYVRSDIIPNNPGPGDIFVQGQTCSIGWDADRTSTWKTLNIDLMTGDNMNMIFLTSVAKGLDGTNPSKNSYSFKCPQVSPHSAVYFYQFSSPSTPNTAWTGRFAITDATQHLTAPSESTQPDGTKIPWGKGVLVESPAPQSASLGPGPASHSTAAATPSVPGSSLQPNATSSVTHNTTTSTFSTSSATTTPSTVSSSETNGAVAAFSVSGILFQAGLGLGLAAFVFAVTL